MSSNIYFKDPIDCRDSELENFIQQHGGQVPPDFEGKFDVVEEILANLGRKRVGIVPKGTFGKIAARASSAWGAWRIPSP